MNEASQVSVKIPADKHRELQYIAQKKGVTVAGYIRMATYNAMEADKTKDSQ